MKNPDPPTDEIQIKAIAKNKVTFIKLRLKWSIKRRKYTLNQSVAVRLGGPQVGRKDGFVSEDTAGVPLIEGSFFWRKSSF